MSIQNIEKILVNIESIDGNNKKLIKWYNITILNRNSNTNDYKISIGINDHSLDSIQVKLEAIDAIDSNNFCSIL